MRMVNAEGFEFGECAAKPRGVGDPRSGDLNREGYVDWSCGGDNIEVTGSLEDEKNETPSEGVAMKGGVE